MAVSLNELRDQGMQLSSEDRETLAIELFESIEPDENEVDDSMAEVIARRSSEVHRGEAVTHDWKDTITEMREWLAIRAEKS